MNSIIVEYAPYLLFLLGLLDGLVIGMFYMHHRIECESKEYVEKALIQHKKIGRPPRIMYRTEG